MDFGHFNQTLERHRAPKRRRSGRYDNFHLAGNNQPASDRPFNHHAPQAVRNENDWAPMVAPHSTINETSKSLSGGSDAPAPIVRKQKKLIHSIAFYLF